jgi:hypothetical protein
VANNAGTYVTITPPSGSSDFEHPTYTSESYAGLAVIGPVQVSFSATGFTRGAYNPGTGGQGILIGKAHWDSGFN